MVKESILPLIPSTHVPPFLHGLDAHSLMLFSHVAPSNPVPVQVQANVPPKEFILC